MASSARDNRVYHQDYIARIRYSNTLPPPPNPPKLLQIPGSGLASGHYTSAAFASRLAREQPLNIEADAELGMPINLVGLPGIFDGDESSIEGLDQPPIPHPNDRPLLRSLASLGKASALASGVSFLRRTEYISADANSRSRVESTTSKDLVRATDSRKRKRPEIDRDDPINVLRNVIKGFALAYPRDAVDDAAGKMAGTTITAEERLAWEKPRNPKQSSLKLLDTYPILPDLDSIPDAGAYSLIKFSTNPGIDVDKYDERLEMGVLRPLPLDPAIQAQLDADKAAHAADPTQPAPIPPLYTYELYVPESKSISAVRTRLDPQHPHKDDDDLYDGEPKFNKDGYFNLPRIRAYETYQQAQNNDSELFFDDTVAVALHDPSAPSVPRYGIPADKGRASQRSKRLQKAAYYYPIYQRANLRPRRPMLNGKMDDSNRCDFLELTIRKPNDDEEDGRQALRDVYEKSHELEQGVQEADGEADADGDVDVAA